MFDKRAFRVEVGGNGRSEYTHGRTYRGLVKNLGYDPKNFEVIRRVPVNGKKSTKGWSPLHEDDYNNLTLVRKKGK